VNLTRKQALWQADRAASRAETLAEDAERLARHEDFRSKTPAFAAAGALWAQTAQAYAALAAALPEQTETTED
jgi:hypothetical protein